MKTDVNVSCVCENGHPNMHSLSNCSGNKVGAYPAFPACYGGMSLDTDNAGKFDAAIPFNTMAVCVPFSAESVWGNVMSAPASLVTWNPAGAGSILAFPSSYPEPADPYAANTCIFRPASTGIYMIAVAAVMYACHNVAQVGHSFDAHWALVKSDTGTLENVTDIGALPTSQRLELSHTVGLTDSEVPIIVHTSQMVKIGHYEEVALFAYFTSEDTNTAGQIDITVHDAPGFSVTPAHIQFVRVG